jgi:uncharacterized protein (DUF2141 family)
MGCVLLLSTSLPSRAAELRVVIEGVASSTGTIIAGLYDSQENYVRAVGESSRVMVNDSNRLIGITLRARGRSQPIVFSDLQPGNYSVIVFHDENDDGKLGKNALGLPIEAYAVSNNARGLMAAPDFEDAAVRVDDRNEVIRITLVYLRALSDRP